MTRAKGSCNCVCSLRIRTLIVLWIVMIGCGFHIWGVNLTHEQFTTHDIDEVFENAGTTDGSSSEKMIREKRSAPANTDIGTSIVIDQPSTWFDLVSRPIGKIHTTIHNSLTEVKNLANQTVQTGISVVKNIPQRVKNTGDKLRGGMQIATEQVSGLADGSVIQKTVQTVGDGISAIKNIPSSVAESVMNMSGVHNSIHNIENKIGERVADDFANAFINRFDKHLSASEVRFQKLVKNYIHYYFFIWSVIGVISSILGIFGVHENIPKCMTSSVFFFYFSAFSFLVIILEINIDSSIELRTFILYEVTGIVWKNFEESIMLINIAAALLTVLSLHFMHIVKKCRSSILKENSNVKADPTNDEVCDHDADSVNNTAGNVRTSEVQTPSQYPEV